MKIFISMDVEGLSGIPSWEWWQSHQKETSRIIFWHLMPLLQGIWEEDPNAEITLVDSHSKGENITIDDIQTLLWQFKQNGYFTNIDADILFKNFTIINGFPRRDYMMAGLDDTYDGVIFLGSHSMAGGGGAMDHTYASSTIYSVRINGQEVGETTINAAFAGEFGIPVIMVVGQEELRKEVNEFLPGTVFVSVQESIGRFATRNFFGTYVSSRIKEGIKKAVESLRKGSITPLMWTPPIQVEIDWLASSMADVVSQMPIMERISPRTTRYTVEDWKDGFRWLLSAVYMSYLGRR